MMALLIVTFGPVSPAYKFSVCALFTPQNGPIFVILSLQPRNNSTIRYLPNRKNVHSISFVTPMPYKNHKNCERFQYPWVTSCRLRISKQPFS